MLGPPGLNVLSSFASDFQCCCLTDQGSPSVIQHIVSVESSSLLLHSYCPPPFRRKAEGHSFRLSVLPSVLPSVVPSFRPSFRPPKVLCTLCAQLLLQFYADSFET